MKILLTGLLVGFSLQVYAESKTLEEFNKKFQAGSYAQALEELKNSEEPNYYQKGLTYSRMQEYDTAIINYEKAILEKNNSKPLYYEYGQALFANNNLRKSRDAFKNSIALNYNRHSSLYYVGHISQVLEEYNDAKKAYMAIIREPKLDQKIEQIAKFQLAETFLSLIRINESNKAAQESDVGKKIIPMLKNSFEVDKSSLVSFDIEKRIKELEKEFNLDPDTLINGRKISAKRFNAYFDIKSKFDDNVTNSNFENDSQQSHKESYIVEAEAEIKYDYVIKKKIITTPTLRFNLNKYSNQDDDTVYQNDSNLFTASLKNKFEHKYKEAPASFIFDFDMSKTYKDYSKVHSKDYYSSSKMFTIGEQLSISNRGDTTFKFKYKDYTAYTDALNNHTVTFSIDQTLSIRNSHLLIITFSADLTDNYNNTSSSTNNYMTRVDYVFPEIIPTYNLTASITATLTDTLESNATRGLEKSLNPTIEISKEITNKIKGIITIDYTNTKSKLDSYTYQKAVSNLELKYSF